MSDSSGIKIGVTIYGMLSKAITALSLVFGVALLVVATYFYIRATREQALSLQSLSLPVSLVPGIVKTPGFRTDFDSNYEIAVDWDAKVRTPRTGPMIIDISWELSEGAKIAAEGNSQEQENGGVSEEPGILYERRIGSFKAQKGHSYTLILHVKRDAPDQNIVHPRVVVQIPKFLWEDHAMVVGFAKLIADVSVVVGLAAVIGAYAFWKRRRGRMTRQVPRSW